MRSLTGREIAGLHWLADSKNNPRAGDIWQHGAAIRSLRELGLAKFARVGGVRITILTKSGEKKREALTYDPPR